MAKRQHLWCEASKTATLLDCILVQDSAKSPPFTQFFRVDAKYAKHLRVFGEMCVVADTDPNDHRFFGCRGVFKVKRNGVYHVRLVAKGFSQIPVMDFTDN